MNYTNLAPHKRAFIFELDDVLFPKQDYLLQVYYLFANVLEYTELKPSAGDLLAFLTEQYKKDGEQGLFEKAATHFGIDKKHEASFKSMHVNPKLPLKLLLYKEALSLLTYLIGEGKSVFILTKGNPMMQFNKMKQMQWKGLDEYIKAYFYDEIVLKSDMHPIDYVLAENNMTQEEAICFYSTAESEVVNKEGGIECLNIQLFLT